MPAIVTCQKVMFTSNCALNMGSLDFDFELERLKHPNKDFEAKVVQAYGTGGRARVF